jgi:hypothetical protein
MLFCNGYPVSARRRREERQRIARQIWVPAFFMTCASSTTTSDAPSSDARIAAASDACV